MAKEVFDLIEPFAGYAFNKAHSVTYAMIAYRTAYLKANYPTEYMTAVLTMNMGQPDKIASAVTECHRLGILALPPDINESDVTFTIEEKDGKEGIRFGLAAIKNVGPGAVESIVAERDKGGSFRSIEDFCRRCDLRGVNKRVIESLIKAGALDPLGDRGTLLNNINRILSLAQREQHLRETGQATMFDLWGEKAPVPMPGLELEAAEVPVREMLVWEKELTGVYLSEHPFNAVAGSLGLETTLCGQIDADLTGQTITVVGMTASVRYLFTRDRNPFASVILEDLSGQVEVMVWPRTYADTTELWQEGNILEVSGKVKLREDRVQLSCNVVHQYQPGAQPVVQKEEASPLPLVEKPAVIEKAAATPEPAEKRRIVISLRQTNDKEKDKADLDRLVTILKDFPGQDEVKMRVANGEKVVNFKLYNVYIHYCPELRQRLVEVIGEDGFTVESR